MPLIGKSTYRAPIFLGNGHVQTIFPQLLRRVRTVDYQRERIATPDGDFLDLDWSRIGARRLTILSHGLEGNSSRTYIQGMVRALNQEGWDALAWNFRGCSGEPNATLRFYHSGATEDLQTVIEHVLQQRAYTAMALVGFSLGGNMILKYLGECAQRVPSIISGAVVFSVPCDLTAGSVQMARPENALYMKRFLHMLHEKIRAKMITLPGQIHDDGYERIKSFQQFDDRYTAPLHGFKSAADYWQRASSSPLIPFIRVPTLLVNAQNDPFLAGDCYPVREAEANPDFFLEMPASGGHVGFVTFNATGRYWSEARALAFLNGTG